MLEPVHAVEQLAAALENLPPRALAVYSERCLRSQRTTLEELGKRFEVTRERIRQIEVKVAKKLQRVPIDLSWLSHARAMRLRDVAHLLGADDSVAAELTAQNPRSMYALGIAAYLHLGGAVLLRNFVVSAAAWDSVETALQETRTHPQTPLTSLLRRIERDLPGMSSAELAAFLVAEGIVAHSESAPKRTNAERVSEAFAAAEGPLTRRALMTATGLTERQVASVMNRKDRFMWVGRAVFAPTDWGMPTYHGTEQALVDELQERGGAATVSELIDAVRTKFGCTESSCFVYLSASPRLRREREEVYLRSGNDFDIGPGNPSRQRRVYSDRNQGLVWAIDIDGDVLRGSGRAVPPAVAAYFGVAPSSPVSLDFPGTAVTLRYSGILVAASSLRVPAEAMGAKQGDRLLVRMPTRGEWSLDVARVAEPFDSCALAFAGARNDDESHPYRSLAACCWQSDARLLRETLWDRNEDRLLSLLGLTPDDPRGNVINLDDLDSMLGDGRPSRRELASTAGLGPQGLAPDAGEKRARLSSVGSSLLVRRVSELTNLNPRDIEIALLGSALGDFPPDPNL